MSQLDRIEAKMDRILELLDRGGKAKKRAPEPLQGLEDPAWVSFWRDYPRKVGKPAAIRAWKQLNEADRRKVIALLPDWVGAWQGQDKRYIPHPATWLNQRRFEDDIEDAVPEPEKAKPRNEQEWLALGKERGMEPKAGEGWEQFKARVWTS